MYVMSMGCIMNSFPRDVYRDVVTIYRLSPIVNPPRRRGDNGAMSALASRLQSDLTAAMKDRDEVRTATLRMVLAAISTEQVSGTAARELSDDEVVTVLSREFKKRREAAAAFAEAGRTQSAERERAEEAVLAGVSSGGAALGRARGTGCCCGQRRGRAGATGPGAMGVVMKALHLRSRDVRTARMSPDVCERRSRPGSTAAAGQRQRLEAPRQTLRTGMLSR